MKNTIFFLAILVFLHALVYSQQAVDHAVQLESSVLSDPAQIELIWVPDQNVNSYFIFRNEGNNGNEWGELYAVVPGSEPSFLDTDVVAGQVYEYKIQKNTATTGFGYISTGIDIPEVGHRGRLLFVLDTTYITYFSSELNVLLNDMVGDGWSVKTIGVSRYDGVIEVKEKIVDEYYNAPLNTRSLFLFGHVPVPYSGNIYPDGHPNHEGAWPADTYYSDMDGEWTDLYNNNTVASGTRNDNVPGDGEFDQHYTPTKVELQTGRVDFAQLNAFQYSEEELLRRYLIKDHAYRHKILEIESRALIDDNFGDFGGEAFAASGWKNFAPLVGAENIEELDFIGTLGSSDYLWAYGCGPGSFTSCSQVVNTVDLATDSIRTIFTSLFGSYFGDWDSNNNLLRSTLASGTTLTSCWSGRPFWQFHQMGMGETIGFCTKATMNNTTKYESNYGGGFVHIGLMGDPTLRSDIVAPPDDVEATFENGNVEIIWSEASDDVIGYNVYRKSISTDLFEKINNDPVTEENYTDLGPIPNGENIYMVRSLALENNYSGSYYNLSQGILDTANFTVGLYNGSNPKISMVAFPNPVMNDLEIKIKSHSQNEVNISFKDMYGATVISEKLRVKKEVISVRFDLSGLASGVYVLNLESADSRTSRKIVKTAL